MTTFAVTCLENVISSSEILFYLSGNVLIPEDEKKFRDWFTVTLFLLSFVVFYSKITVCGLGLGLVKG